MGEKEVMTASEETAGKSVVRWYGSLRRHGWSHAVAGRAVS
jgi:hypothetical protein